MKTKKWLWIALASILTLVVLAGVGAAGYRLGLTQNPAVIQQFAELRAQRAEQFQKQNAGQLPQQNDKTFDPRSGDGRGFDPHSKFDRRDDRGRGGSPFFGFFHLIVLGALLWFGYRYAKNSGWKLVRETPQPAPPVVQSAPVEDEKKDEA
jgi:hypothetical protein